ncbi:hypothetical protein [Mesorhizobium sp. CAU 1732]|uniref:hypothetical protein n=1 Tax=Mesorhizobium sp. CAU 1732 TaxID=3140358 RepID=UPI00326014C1
MESVLMRGAGFSAPDRTNQSLATDAGIRAKSAVAWDSPMKHRLLAYTPIFATALLTAAIFALPATSAQRVDPGAIDTIALSSTHIDHDAVERIASVRD